MIVPRMAQELIDSGLPLYGPMDDSWDTILTNLPTVLIDEANEAGLGRKGRSSKTFSITATTLYDPVEARALFARLYPETVDKRLMFEQKNKGISDFESYWILDELERADAHYHSTILHKSDEGLPDGFNPKDGKKAYRAVLEKTIDMTLEDAETDRMNLYLDEHTSISSDAGVKIARSVARDRGIVLNDVRQLESKNEPILMLIDTPVGVVGRYVETGKGRPAYAKMDRRMRTVEIRGEKDEN